MSSNDKRDIIILEAANIIAQGLLEIARSIDYHANTIRELSDDLRSDHPLQSQTLDTIGNPLEQIAYALNNIMHKIGKEP